MSGGTFTAPVDGLYSFSVKINAVGILSGHTSGFIYFVFTGGSYALDGAKNPYLLVSGGETVFSGSIMSPMDAGDTIAVKLYVAGSTKVIDVAAGIGNHFEGFLAA